MEETSPAGPPDEPADSAAIVRFLFAVAAAGGVEQRQLARDAGFPAPAEPAPRSSRPFAEALGTPRILRGYADTLVPPRPATWQERFAQLLDEALDHGSPELGEVARRLFVSRRTLQRRLAEQGTSWRAELDSARRRRALANGGAPITPGGLARRLGYAAPRSARRALRRWDSQTS